MPAAAAPSPAEALALLRWYAEMGVDIAVGDDPVDRFAESAAVPPAAPARLPPSAEPPPPVVPRSAVPASPLHTAAPDIVAEAEIGRAHV